MRAHISCSGVFVFDSRYTMHASNKARPPYAQLLVAGLGGLALGAGVVTIIESSAQDGRSVAAMNHLAETELRAERLVDKTNEVALLRRSVEMEHTRVMAANDEIERLKGQNETLHAEIEHTQQRHAVELKAERSHTAQWKTQYEDAMNDQELSKGLQRVDLGSKSAHQQQLAALGAQLEFSMRQLADVTANRDARLSAQQAITKELEEMQKRCDEWQALCTNGEKEHAEQLAKLKAENNLLKKEIQGLKSIIAVNKIQEKLKGTER